MKEILSDKICLTDMLLWMIDLGLFEIGTHDPETFACKFFIVLSLLFLMYIMWANYKWFYKDRMQLKGAKFLYIFLRFVLLEFIIGLLILEMKSNLEKIYVRIFVYGVVIIFTLFFQNIVFRIYLLISESKSDFLFGGKGSDYQKIVFIRDKIYEQTGLNLANDYFSLDNLDDFKRLAYRISQRISKVDLEEYRLVLTISDNSFNRWDWNKLFGNVIENGIAGIISMVFFGSLAVQVANISLPSVSVHNSLDSWTAVIIYLAMIIIVISFPVMKVHFKHRKVAKQKSFFIALFELTLTCKGK